MVVSETTDLLREERVDAGEAHDLRQLRGVAKRVCVRAHDCRRSESWAMTEDGKRREEERGTGQPELGTVGAEFALEVLLAEEELTDQRFLFPYQHHTNGLAQSMRAGAKVTTYSTRYVTVLDAATAGIGRNVSYSLFFAFQKIR